MLSNQNAWPRYLSAVLWIEPEVSSGDLHKWTGPGWVLRGLQIMIKEMAGIYMIR